MMMASLMRKNAHPSNSAHMKRNIASNMIVNGMLSVWVAAALLVAAERICSGAMAKLKRDKIVSLMGIVDQVAALKGNAAMQWIATQVRTS